jgi:hypothetical protein
MRDKDKYWVQEEIRVGISNAKIENEQRLQGFQEASIRYIDTATKTAEERAAEHTDNAIEKACEQTEKNCLEYVRKQNDEWSRIHNVTSHQFPLLPSVISTAPELPMGLQMPNGYEGKVLRYNLCIDFEKTPKKKKSHKKGKKHATI